MSVQHVYEMAGADPDGWGLLYRPDFISPEEESELLAHIDAAPWLTSLKRRVQHYGWAYNYKSRSVRAEDYIGPLPAWVKNVAERLVAEGVVSPLTVLDQVIVNEYLPGQGIAHHVDQPAMFGAEVVTVSLGGATTMDFALGDSVRHVRLEPRSVARLAGEARYRWTHGITARLTDQVGGVRVARSRRVSLTLRSVRGGTLVSSPNAQSTRMS